MNIPDIRCFVYLQRLIETPACMSQCCNLLSWRATRPIYHLYLKAFILNYETFCCLPCPRNLKGGLRSPGPEDSVPPNQPGTLRLAQGTLLLAPLLMVQILRTGGPDFQEVLRVILTADIISGAHFSCSGAHLWLLDISGAHLPKNYFDHDSQDLRI